MGEQRGTRITLPSPVSKGSLTVEEAIARRRSVRAYRQEALSLSQLSQVLWAAYGITSSDHQCRAVPSAGATYPLEIFIFIGKGGVTGLEEGVYRFDSETHSLSRHKQADLRKQLADAALGQWFIAQSPVDIVICALYHRTSWRYGKRGERYVHMEAGHAGQNIHLQAEALGLATVAVGAFDDDTVSRILEIAENIRPLYIMPLGKALGKT